MSGDDGGDGGSGGDLDMGVGVFGGEVVGDEVYARDAGAKPKYQPRKLLP